MGKQSLNISIEINGKQTAVGTIDSFDVGGAVFSYRKSYLGSPDPIPVSVSLPLQDEPFSPQKTRYFFDGLLPEGFTRRSVAQSVRADENDYLTILTRLGGECLGAIQVSEDEPVSVSPSYEKLSFDQVRQLAAEGTSRSVQIVTEAHLSLTGASGKVGLYLDETSGDWFLPLGSAPSTHILKQSHVRLQDIVTNEQLCLRTASRLGLNIPESFIVNTGEGRDEDILFATKRFDRIFPSSKEEPLMITGKTAPRRLHQEDFAQAMGISSLQKYESEGEHYMKDMFDLLRRISADPIRDQLRLWDVIVYHYLVGNTDGHIKNFSLLYSQDLKSIRLAPAYDILSTSIYGNNTRNMAFRIGGELSLDLINRNHFEKAASDIGIGPRIAMRHFDQIASRFTDALRQSAEELEEKGFKAAKKISEEILRTGGIHKV